MCFLSFSLFLVHVCFRVPPLGCAYRTSGRLPPWWVLLDRVTLGVGSRARVYHLTLATRGLIPHASRCREDNAKVLTQRKGDLHSLRSCEGCLVTPLPWGLDAL